MKANCAVSDRACDAREAKHSLKLLKQSSRGCCYSQNCAPHLLLAAESAAPRTYLGDRPASGTDGEAVGAACLIDYCYYI
jgi:hypothetical protein